MWFTPNHFTLCNSLRLLGLEPRFEVGDVVARGFADLGFEEFQVLPGPRILSLTAGTVKPLPDDHREHFFWIPSADEVVSLIEQSGATINECFREDCRDWRIVVQISSGKAFTVSARSIHETLLRALIELYSVEKEQS
ncbi:MAG: hypothetical protein ACK5GN_04165 [Pseudomonadota bacterium]|jgi:hypothetical protein